MTVVPWGCRRWRLSAPERRSVNNPIRRIRPEKTGVGAPLGELETAVMRHIWACGGAGCQGGDVQRALDSDRPVALTTVLTTLDRLLAKGILRREREGKAYRYWPLLTEAELQQRIVEGVLDRLIAQFPKAVAAYFAQQGDPEAEGGDLAELARRVEAAGSEEDRRSLEQEGSDGL